MRNWKIISTQNEIEYLKCWSIEEVLVETKFNILNIKSIEEIE